MSSRTEAVLTDGLVTLRPRQPGDRAGLVAGRDEQGRRFLGPAGADPKPAFCILADRELAGWVDYDRDEEHDWLKEGEVNIGYELFRPFRGRGLATRAVRLLLHHLAVADLSKSASLLVDPENAPSLALAARAGFDPAGELQGQRYFQTALPRLVLDDGVVSIRRQREDDLERHLGAIDESQLAWLWHPAERASWEEMTPGEQRDHQLAQLCAGAESFGRGPKWRFSVDAGSEAYVAYIDCDLANDLVPAGEANIGYATHPQFRQRGYGRRAVELVASFLAENTGAREAHIIVDSANEASLGVARAVGATERERFVRAGRTMIRHVLALARQTG